MTHLYYTYETLHPYTHSITQLQRVDIHVSPDVSWYPSFSWMWMSIIFYALGAEQCIDFITVCPALLPSSYFCVVVYNVLYYAVLCYLMWRLWCDVTAVMYMLQNLAQTGLPHPGASVAQRVAFMRGPLGLMRGMYPGDVPVHVGFLSNAMRNGVLVVVVVRVVTHVVGVVTHARSHWGGECQGCVCKALGLCCEVMCCEVLWGEVRWSVVSLEVLLLLMSRSFCHVGALGGGLRNAVGMVAMVKAQELVTSIGLRDSWTKPASLSWCWIAL